MYDLSKLYAQDRMASKKGGSRNQKRRYHKKREEINREKYGMSRKLFKTLFKGKVND